jgi:hypothetical protein
LTEDEVHNKLIDVWQEVKVLTGAVLYKMGEGLEEQLEVLKLFVASHPQFTGLTVKEIAHAFYLNAQGEYGEVYRHYNKELNAEFVGDVLRAYVKYKRVIYSQSGKAIKDVLNPEAAKVRVALPGEEELQQLVQMHYELYQQGLKDFIVMPVTVYKLMRKYGGISISSKEHWRSLVFYGMRERKYFGEQSTLRKDAWEKERIERARAIYSCYAREGWISWAEYRMVVDTFRKMLYLSVFEAMSYMGVKDIFKEVSCER